LIDDLSAAGVTVLVTTHYLDEAEHCHRVAIISAGTLAALGTTAELKGLFDGRPIVELRSPRPIEVMRLLDTAPEVEKTSVFGTAVHAVLRSSGQPPDAVVAELTRRLEAAGVSIDEAETVPPSLEDVFLEVAGRPS
ncbi:MAG: DUF4162 domain-containing protein, partial [Vicinamibacterales bacterium]